MAWARKKLWSNKCQEIYHKSDEKYKHQSDEWRKIFRNEFIEMCINDGLVKSHIDIIKPAPTLSRY